LCHQEEETHDFFKKNITPLTRYLLEGSAKKSDSYRSCGDQSLLSIFWLCRNAPFYQKSLRNYEYDICEHFGRNVVTDYRNCRDTHAAGAQATPEPPGASKIFKFSAKPFFNGFKTRREFEFNCP
jgi:hypothetical protein